MNKLTFAFMSFICFGFAVSVQHGQAQTTMECGSQIESEFTGGGETLHEYQVHLDAGVRLVAIAEVPGNYTDLRIELGLYSSSGFEIDEIFSLDASNFNTAVLDSESNSGVYDVVVRGYTQTGGSYVLYLNCRYPDGNVSSAINYVNAAECGSIIENNFGERDRFHRYYLPLTFADSVTITAESTQSYNDLRIELGFYSPSGFEIEEIFSLDANEVSTVDADNLSETGIYVLGVQAYTSVGGNYTVSIGCTLADGTVINPGEAPPESATSSITQPWFDEVFDAGTAGSFSGFGFPGLAPVDFTNLARLPLILDTPMTGAVTPDGGEIIGFVFEGEAGDTASLSLNRLSGNLNLGLVVLQGENQIIFQSVMTTSAQLLTDFVLPFDGEYTVAVFRVDVLPPTDPQATAFQVTLSMQGATAANRSAILAAYEPNALSPPIAMQPSLTPFPTPTSTRSQPTARPTNTRTPIPPTPSQITCPNALTPRLSIGDQARITPGLPNRLRESPSLNGRQIGSLEAGEIITILDGPICSDGYVWWQVNFNGQIGWTVEATANEYWIVALQ